MKRNSKSFKAFICILIVLFAAFVTSICQQLKHPAIDLPEEIVTVSKDSSHPDTTYTWQDRWGIPHTEFRYYKH